MFIKHNLVSHTDAGEHAQHGEQQILNLNRSFLGEIKTARTLWERIQLSCQKVLPKMFDLLSTEKWRIIFSSIFSLESQVSASACIPHDCRIFLFGKYSTSLVLNLDGHAIFWFFHCNSSTNLIYTANIKSSEGRTYFTALWIQSHQGCEDFQIRSHRDAIVNMNCYNK